MPADFAVLEVERLSPAQRAALAAGGALLVILVATGALLYRRSRAHDSPEYVIAESKGFTLEEPLGSGHFGRVYRARSKATGQPVAIKVVNLLPKQKRQAAAAWRECQLLSRLHHDCVVRTITFHAARVERKSKIVETAPGNEYVELGFDVAKLIDGGDGPLQGSSSSGGSGSGSRGSGSDPTTLSSSEGLEGVVSIQVQLVMQFCDMGTLDSAIKQGLFKGPNTGLPRMRHILLTAAEIARGLEYLHHPDRRLIHRDLTATNVLLATHGDERGFRALLSDFGLSTTLSEEQTHRTSEVKGTISYMSPEVFMFDDISPALDIYSLGIILHMMCAGGDPYQGKPSAMIVLSKVRAGEHPEEARMPPIPGCPPAFQQLVWDCTAANRRDRPSAAGVVQRIEALLSGL
ncbi:hypothetical protein ABPG75_002990 [Micractinium tetrahymenae]